MNSISNEEGGMTSGNKTIKKTMKEHYKQVYVNDFSNLEKWINNLKKKINIDRREK
jgi:hypothetical protein